MNKYCKKYEKQLYLYREGELTKKQEQQLSAHLAICPVCSELLAELEQHQQLTGVWKNKTQDVTAPADLAKSVITGIRRSELERFPWWQRLLDFFTIPQIQFASVLLVVLALGTILVQESLVMYRIAGLEERISTHSSKVVAGTGNEYRRIVQRFEQYPVEHLGVLQKGDGPEYLVLDRDMVQAFLQEYKQTRIQNELLLQLLKKDYPELLQLFEKDTLKIDDLESLNIKQFKVKNLLKTMNRSL